MSEEQRGSRVFVSCLNMKKLRLFSSLRNVWFLFAAASHQHSDRQQRDVCTEEVGVGGRVHNRSDSTLFKGWLTLTDI